MEIEEALFHWASNQPQIANLVSGGGKVRMFKGKAPQGTPTPFIVYQRSGAERQALQCDVDGGVRVSIQVDLYAVEWAAMAQLAKRFRESLKPGNVNAGAGFPVYMGAGGPGGADDSPATSVKVKGATLTNEFDSEDIEPGYFRRTQLWQFWVWEP